MAIKVPSLIIIWSLMPEICNSGGYSEEFCNRQDYNVERGWQTLFRHQEFELLR